MPDALTHTHEKRYTNFYPFIYTQWNTHTQMHAHFFVAPLQSAWVASFFPFSFLTRFLSLFTCMRVCVCTVHSTAQRVFCSCFYFPFRHLKEILLTAVDELCKCIHNQCVEHFGEREIVQNLKMVCAFYLFSFALHCLMRENRHDVRWSLLLLLCTFSVFCFLLSFFFLARPTI